MKAAFMIHGFLTDKDDFAPLISAVAGMYDKIVCPNLPAHSKEEVELSAVPKHDKIISFVDEQYRKLKAEADEVDVFGFSMGGALATMVASVYGADRLVLLAPANKFLSFMFPFKRAIFCAKAKKEFKDSQKYHSEYETDYLSEIKEDSEMVKVFAKKLIPRYTPKNVTEFAKVIKTCNSYINIKCPTLILYGECDQLVPPSVINYLIKHIHHDNYKVKRYPDFSHLMLHSAGHQRLVSEIVKFLEENKA